MDGLVTILELLLLRDLDGGGSEVVQLWVGLGGIGVIHGSHYSLLFVVGSGVLLLLLDNHHSSCCVVRHILGVQNSVRLHY